MANRLASGVAALALCFYLCENSGNAQAVDVPVSPVPSSPRTFTTLVVADVPPVLGSRFEELTSRIGARCNISLRPLWWRLNMMAAESETSFTAQAVADALGCTVISDAGEALIVAARETPEAAQAEARLFLMSLFNDLERPRSMWNAITASPNRSRGSSSSRKPGGESDKEEPFALAGTLADPAVMNALGLEERDFKLAMAHYSIADFTVGHIPDTRSSRYSSSSSKPKYPNMAAIVISARKCAYDVMPPAFDPWLSFPTGQMIGESSALFLQTLLSGGFNFRWTGYDPARYRQRSVTRNPNEESDPFAVTMLIDDFDTVAPPDPDRLLEFYDALEDLADGTAGHSSALIALRKEVECRLTPRGFHWADPTAVLLKRGPATNSAQVRQAKRALTERMAGTLTLFASRNGDSAKYMEGMLNNWTVRSAYSIDDYNLFNLQPYSSSALEIVADQEPHKGQMIFRTISSFKQNPFAVRIDPKNGAVNWLSGEPESEELAKARHEEMLLGTNLLCEAAAGAAVNDRSFAPSRDWIIASFDGKGFKPRTTSSTDYDVCIILPGIMRVVAEAGDIRLSALIDLEDGSVAWETGTKPDKAPQLPFAMIPGRG